MDEQLSVLPTHKPSQFRPLERPQLSTLTVGSAIVLPLESQIQNLTGNSDSGDHASGVSYVKQTTIKQVSIVRDLDLPADHELHINQVRIIRTFFDSSTFALLHRPLQKHEEELLRLHMIDCVAERVNILSLMQYQAFGNMLLQSIVRQPRYKTRGM